METAEHSAASFATVVALLEKLSCYRYNYKRNLNHSVLGEKHSLPRVCKWTRIRKERHRNFGSVPCGVADLADTQSLQTRYGPNGVLSLEVKGPTSVDNHTAPCSAEVL
jgi:hypothetical protein